MTLPDYSKTIISGPLPNGWTPEEVRWVRLKWHAIRTAQRKADEANNNWQRLNDEINAWMDRGGETDIVQRTKIKSESLPLKDALATGNWHSRNAERHIQDVQLFLQMKTMGLV